MARRTVYEQMGGGLDIMTLLKEFFGSGEDKRRSKLSLKALERSEELSDVSILSSMLDTASTSQEFKLANQTYDNISKTMSNKDPVVQAKIIATGKQIEENTILNNQFTSAVKLVNGLLSQGEFDDFDINNLTYKDIGAKVDTIRRFKHIIDSGKERGYTYSPERGTGEGYLHSEILSKRLDDYSEQLDAAVYARIDKPEGKLPQDAVNAIMIGDVERLKDIEKRELSNYKRILTAHSSRYSSLNSTKMKADATKNVDGTLNLMPTTMMADLQNQGDEQVKVYMEALKGDPMLYAAFMNGFKNNTGVTVDYDTYSKLLEAQMKFESGNIKEANQGWFEWTGSYLENFREAPDYSKIKEEVIKSGLQVDGADVGTGAGVSDDVVGKKIVVPYSGMPEDVRGNLEYANVQGDYSISNIIAKPDVPSSTKKYLSRKATIKKVNNKVGDTIVEMVQPYIQPYHEKMYTSPSAREDIKGAKRQYAGAIYKEKAPQIKHKYSQAINKENKEYREKKTVLDKDYPEFIIANTPHLEELKEHGNKERAKLKKTHDKYLADLNTARRKELEAITGVARTKGLDKSEILKFAMQFTTKGGAQSWFNDMSKEEQNLLMQLVKGYKSNLSLIESKAP